MAKQSTPPAPAPPPPVRTEPSPSTYHRNPHVAVAPGGRVIDPATGQPFPPRGQADPNAPGPAWAGAAEAAGSVGDYLAPVADRGAQLLKARYQGRITLGQTGAWLKEKQPYNNYVVNVRALSADNEMQGIRIFEFDNKGLVVSMTEAASASFAQDNAWSLSNAERTDFQIRPSTDGLAKAAESANVTRTRADTLRWPTDISAEMVSVALLKPDRMATIDLFKYVQHLKANGQSAQRYEIEFWRKVFYPLSCLVMVILSLPFAYLHFRSGGIATYVFSGVMIGISFFLLNNVFGYIGNLQNWQPWLAAAVPGLLYTLISLGAFGWLVLRR